MNTLGHGQPPLSRGGPGASTDQLLTERGKTHGSFADNATVAQGLKDILRNREVAYGTLSLQQREALDFICSKIGRIMSGQPNFKDHWDDIAGYAQLVAKECK